jgi:hypothetical protein
MKDILKIVGALTLFSYIVSPVFNFLFFLVVTMVMRGSEAPQSQFNALKIAPQCMGVTYGK